MFPILQKDLRSAEFNYFLKFIQFLSGGVGIST